MDNTFLSSGEFPSNITSLEPLNKEEIECGPPEAASSCSTITELEDNKFLIDTEEKFNFDKFKAILKTPSSTNGKNLYDHLVEIVKRIIDERPINVTDYFEQFSRHLRANKYEDMAICNEPHFLKYARSVIKFVKPDDMLEEEIGEESKEEEMTSDHTSKSTIYAKLQRYSSQNETIIQNMHFFGFCGLGFHIDEAFQLSLAVQKVQLHRHVLKARFWGKIYGLKAPYYIVEAQLTRVELQYRLQAMKRKLIDEMRAFIHERDKIRTAQSKDNSLIPGIYWQEYPDKELAKMRVPIAFIPMLRLENTFPGIEEQIGTGLNRQTYFVTNSLSNDWEELPTVAPKHIFASKIFKKYFTGDLNENLEPLFPGCERNYLRAMIARISAGTFIAPIGYYRRMTRKELRLLENEEEDTEEGAEDEEEIYDNDTPITQNKNYKALSLEETALLSNWVHCKPNILNQGRILHFNEDEAILDLEKIVIQLDTEDIYEQNGTEYDEEGEEEENKEDSYDSISVPEVGPELFSSCADDKSDDDIQPWTIRYSSVFSKINQMVLLRSNLWPGAYAIAFENMSECIYVGWGFKYVTRGISLPHLKPIENYDFEDSALEMTDPTFEMEERWRRYHERKDPSYVEEMSGISEEVDLDDDEYDIEEKTEIK